jgi:hypothetical protein
VTTITLPPDVEGPLAEAARRRGTTLELLAIDCLREIFVPSARSDEPATSGTLFEFLVGYAGTVDGTTEALSEETGRRFVEGLIEKQRRGRA